MQVDNLFDATSALIVVGGTIAATVMRCGLRDTRTAIASLGGLFGKRFDASRARSELAGHVREMQTHGVIRTAPHHFGDAEFDEATDALIGTRSIGALQAAHVAHKRRRVVRNRRAVRTFNQAADLSPVFGLAGTLVSLSQLPGGAEGAGDFTTAISMAVLTTLYGLLLGNIVFAPLARVVARVGAKEERERQKVLDWLEGQLVSALPAHARPAAMEKAVASIAARGSRA
ncbi:MotA/TolQ/ExbB proton channel family protein [Novosphingobium pentaromativorans]|nr:MotA/TolQ/ExbB proton channel family protein [Novosphingobium pentaromativorans]AIT80663.1 chemotaxis protein MotA [Novosphingobium pentaromativorans US6-1]